MTIPRLAPGGVGRGCFVLCVALCGPLCDALGRGNIGILPHTKTAIRACKWPLRRSCFFWARSALPDTGAKMPPADRRTAHKRREAAGEYRGTVDAKTRPRLSRGGLWWHINRCRYIGGCLRRTGCGHQRLPCTAPAYRRTL